MKFAALVSLGLAAISAVLAAPAPQEHAAPAPLHEAECAEKDHYYLRAHSVKGTLFKERSIVALSEGTIGDVHLPPSFGLENFTIHPSSKPVTFTLEKSTPEGTTYFLPDFGNSTDENQTPFVSQYVLPAPNNLIAMGYVHQRTVDGGNEDCPEDVTCDWVNWTVDPQTSVLQINGKAGAWDAVKTKEGRGWRVVWKKDTADVVHEVQISVARYQGD